MISINKIIKWFKHEYVDFNVFVSTLLGFLLLTFIVFLFTSQKSPVDLRDSSDYKSKVIIIRCECECDSIPKKDTVPII